MIYVPRARPVAAKQLAPNADYTVSLFDPVTGDCSSLGKVRTDTTGSWRCPAPDHKHDWVLVLEDWSTASLRPLPERASETDGGVRKVGMDGRAYPPADIAIERIGDLLRYDLPGCSRSVRPEALALGWGMGEFFVFPAVDMVKNGSETRARGSYRSRSA